MEKFAQLTGNLETVPLSLIRSKRMNSSPKLTKMMALIKLHQPKKKIRKRSNAQTHQNSASST
jgi:hypothetical protein